jgi:splicing factor, arginine/serine-rich 16
LDYVDDLTDKDRQILNEMGRKYNIPDYTRLLRVAKRDRVEKAKELKENQKVYSAFHFHTNWSTFSLL